MYWSEMWYWYKGIDWKKTKLSSLLNFIFNLNILQEFYIFLKIVDFVKLNIKFWVKIKLKVNTFWNFEILVLRQNNCIIWMLIDFAESNAKILNILKIKV
jgi:hypothetical protein